MSMRSTANENFPREAVVALRARGHDVVWMHETAPGQADIDVLRRAREEERLLLTFDKDFGELAYRQGLAVSPGVILFRVSSTSGSDAGRFIVSALESRTDWVGSFGVIEADRIRLRPLAAPR
jgi:predicted nuclease of predicted toxin-antitoxin system